jgi:Arc/MetJ family transcription regulator
MRTNVEINDENMARAMKAGGTRTKRETIDQALVTFAQLKEQAKMKDLWGIGWDGDLEAMRLDE